jgi:tRNA (guanine37-N1)-methyltransferase
MHLDMRPPVNRAMRTLDRSFFKRSLPLAAARVLNNKNIEACRSELIKSKDLLQVRRASPLRQVPGPSSIPASLKCLMLRTDVKPDGTVYVKDIEMENDNLTLDITFYRSVILG